MKYYLTTVLFAFCLMVACGPEVSPELAELNKLERDLEVQPSEERAQAYLDGVVDFVSKNNEDFTLIRPILEKALDVTNEYELDNRKAGFIVPLLKNTGRGEKSKSYLIQLGDLMYGLGKTHASNVIYKKLGQHYGDDPQIDVRAAMIDSSALDTTDYVGYLFNQILVDPDEFGVNKTAAIRFIDAAEALALSDPADTLVPEYLYRAAEVARHRRDLNKSLNLYDWILEEYDDEEIAPNVLFIKGFIIEQDLKQTEQARVIYERFLEKYPDHQMASSAQFLLENLGKSEQEILDMIENKRNESNSSPTN